MKTNAVIKVDKPEMLRSVPTRHHRTLRTSASRRLRAVGLGSAAWRRASAITIAYVSAPDLGAGLSPSSCDIGPLSFAGITPRPNLLQQAPTLGLQRVRGPTGLPALRG
ncbi:hypothetical protein [Streptomyces sp. NPDC059893]|uniref:hypothetical protein n=1 Tax=Streptomyces sp. NPDC059893 TaxID=3346990 RepID=UPI003660147E